MKEKEREGQRGEQLHTLTSLERKGGETLSHFLILPIPQSLTTALFCFILFLV